MCVSFIVVYVIVTYWMYARAAAVRRRLHLYRLHVMRLQSD